MGMSMTESGSNAEVGFKKKDVFIGDGNPIVFLFNTNYSMMGFPPFCLQTLMSVL